MPTGYTAKLYDGEHQTFEQFALTCARAFGALVTMRDEDMQAPIPSEFAPSDHAKRSMERSIKSLAEIRAMSDDDCAEHADLEYRDAVRAKQKSDKETAARRSRYEGMLVAVRAWTPPSADHLELKKFMVQQLTESIDFDCGANTSKPTRKTPAEWREQQIAVHERSIAYDRKSYAEEVERARSRTEWIRSLRESLKKTAVGAA